MTPEPVAGSLDKDELPGRQPFGGRQHFWGGRQLVIAAVHDQDRAPDALEVSRPLGGTPGEREAEAEQGGKVRFRRGQTGRTTAERVAANGGRSPLKRLAANGGRSPLKR